MHQDCINHAKHSGGRSNAERQRDDCRQCESWTFDELPRGIAEILKQGMHDSLREWCTRFANSLMVNWTCHGQTGVRRAKPACCRGCKSPTGKEVANPS